MIYFDFFKKSIVYLWTFFFFFFVKFVYHVAYVKEFTKKKINKKKIKEFTVITTYLKSNNLTLDTHRSSTILHFLPHLKKQ